MSLATWGILAVGAVYGAFGFMCARAMWEGDLADTVWPLRVVGAVFAFAVFPAGFVTMTVTVVGSALALPWLAWVISVEIVHAVF